MTKQYSEVLLISGPTLTTNATEGVSLTNNDCRVLNRKLKAGWELIQPIPHHDDTQDTTVVAFLIGKPKLKKRSSRNPWGGTKGDR